ncbi:alpha/beta fold hydrolase [Frigoribacterium sp. UYMn621]|uniref:alpha/beta hydrolase family protein n=1 Tax=Frigoribacterium sp. UYMn621 TaxID=3156343 RepID=UPI003391B1CB
MADSRRHAVKAFPWIAVAAASLGAIASIATLTVAGVTLVVARTVVTPPKRRPEDTRILSVDGAGDLITLSSTADSRLPGEYSLFFADGGGHARVGDIVAETPETVIRRLLAVDRGDLAHARRGRFSGWFYIGPADLGFPFQNVDIPTELGPAPAWLVPAEGPSTRWVIEVHGRAVRREETLRAVPVFRAAGYTSLLVSYRNDEDAPPSPDGRYGLGDTEWHDVEAALRYAIDHGATDVVLMGWSMGGATVLQTLTRSELAGVVRGIVLDSPVIDWVTALRFQGELLGLPNPIRTGVIMLLGMKGAGRLTGQHVPIDLPRLDFVRRSADLHVPILLMHSDDDGFIPSTASLALAAARPDIVSYERFTVAGHTKLWNFDRARWNDAIAHWLRTAPL